MSQLITETPETLSTIKRINREVNAFNYASDTAVHDQIDFWTAHMERYGRGDCDDYALTKRKRLMDAGFAWQALQPTVCKMKHTGEGHLVLLVHTDKKVLILDNVNKDVKTWPGSDYDWIFRLDGERGWVNFE